MLVWLGSNDLSVCRGFMCSSQDSILISESWSSWSLMTGCVTSDRLGQSQGLVLHIWRPLTLWSVLFMLYKDRVLIRDLFEALEYFPAMMCCVSGWREQDLLGLQLSSWVQVSSNICFDRAPSSCILGRYVRILVTFKLRVSVKASFLLNADKFDWVDWAVLNFLLCCDYLIWAWIVA